MHHRHLNHQDFTLAAIDDVIDRGGVEDWFELRSAALADPSLLERVRRVCSAHLRDPYAQRFHFWMHYAQRRSA